MKVPVNQMHLLKWIVGKPDCSWRRAHPGEGGRGWENPLPEHTLGTVPAEKREAPGLAALGGKSARGRKSLRKMHPPGTPSALIWARCTERESIKSTQLERHRDAAWPRRGPGLCKARAELRRGWCTGWGRVGGRGRGCPEKVTFVLDLDLRKAFVKQGKGEQE